MVFCLCGRPCFSKTLVINAGTRNQISENSKRPTYYLTSLYGLDKIGQGVSTLQDQMTPTEITSNENSLRNKHATDNQNLTDEKNTASQEAPEEQRKDGKNEENKKNGFLPNNETKEEENELEGLEKIGARNNEEIEVQESENIEETIIDRDDLKNEQTGVSKPTPRKQKAPPTPVKTQSEENISSALENDANDETSIKAKDGKNEENKKNGFLPNNETKEEENELEGLEKIEARNNEEIEVQESENIEETIIDRDDLKNEQTGVSKPTPRKQKAPPTPVKTQSEENISSALENDANDKTSIKTASEENLKDPPTPDKAKSEENISSAIENEFSLDTSKKRLQFASEGNLYEEQRKDSEDTPKLSIDMEAGVRERREGVAPIPTRIDEDIEKLPVFIKDPKDQDLIKKAIGENDFLNQIIRGEQMKDVVDAMYNKEISKNETIIKQGDKGSHMFVSAKGLYQIIINGKTVSEFKNIRVFGELAILYNAKRQATIKAASAGRVWVLDSTVYQKIQIRHNIRRQDELMNFLINNEILNVVGNEALQIVANLLKSEFFKSGQVIVKQGDRGDKFYIIRAGTVTITKDGEGVKGVYKKGDCFGELALLEEDARQATVTANAPGVECLTLTRKEFIDHLGDIKKFKYIKVDDTPKNSIRASVSGEHADVDLKELRIIKTLGVGGFGRVELVQHTKAEALVFALKYLKKIEVVEQNQQEHVYNEKVIQMNCRSPFIVKLYRTYKDAKYIYFLMEACLGGDLWSLLQKQKNRRFDEREARFICACVLEAFDYLHSRSIVYRDLKPENLLIAANGYVKLTDFGFAKKIPNRGKTYTFAGTPEYVAPEIVLNRGHDRAVDYWAFGSFVFEMLSGRTPFRSDDPSHMRTYNKILSGIQSIHFPTYINIKARHLIEKLCKSVPSERLGMQKQGIQDIKGHKWFMGMDWAKLIKCNITSPFKPKLDGPIDTKHFDHFKRDTDNPPEELSGWDEKF